MILILLTSFLFGTTMGQFVGTGNTDPCPEGFIHHKKSCYKYFITNVKFSEAWTLCNMVNSELLAIESKDENDFITQVTRRIPAYYWTGGNDLLTPGQYTWGTRSYRRVTYAAWDTDEPRPISKNPISGAVHSGCIQISNGKWRLAPCFSGAANVICELEIDGQVGP